MRFSVIKILSREGQTPFSSFQTPAQSIVDFAEEGFHRLQFGHALNLLARARLCSGGFKSLTYQSADGRDSLTLFQDSGSSPI
jgi:hypothetical protein